MLVDYGFETPGDVCDFVCEYLQKYICMTEEQSVNTDGGTFTSGGWRTRVLNTERSDPQSIGSISSNQITLAAGTYICRISVPAYRVDGHKAQLYDTTGEAVLLKGTSEFSGSGGDYGQTRSIITGAFVLSEQSILEVRHRCTTTRNTDGLGVAANLVDAEVYTIAEFWLVS